MIAKDKVFFMNCVFLEKYLNGWHQEYRWLND